MTTDGRSLSPRGMPRRLQLGLLAAAVVALLALVVVAVVSLAGTR